MYNHPRQGYGRHDEAYREWGGMPSGRIARGLHLLGMSWSVVRADRRLVVYPAVSAVVSLGLGALAFVVSTDIVGGGHWKRTVLLASIVVSYPATFVTLFCGVALAAALRAKLDGERVDMALGWRAARQRVGIIAAWTVLVCTVGALIRLLEDRVPLGGKVVGWLADVSWSLATLFAVPVLAYEGLGPIATLRRSALLFKEQWGEQLTGGVVIGASAALAYIPCLILVVVGVGASGPVATACVAAGGGGMLLIASFETAMDQVFRVFLYRHALGSADASPFGSALDAPIVEKRSRWA